MKKLIIILLVAFFGCADINEDLNSPIIVKVHGDGFIEKSNVNFHGLQLKTDNWDMYECQSCHGADFAGGTVNKSCNVEGCHTYNRGPKECNTCHGDFEFKTSIAPPQDLSDNTEITSPGVGAHQVHLIGTASAKAVSCYECHKHLDGYDDPAHIDGDGRSELVWGELATLVTNASVTQNYNSNLPIYTPSPEYDFNNYTCSNTYCHGYFKGGNLDNAPSFTEGSNGAKCGSCHGNPDTGSSLPPSPHPQVTQCQFCHAEVAVSDSIIAPEYHVNGKLYLYGNEIEF